MTKPLALVVEDEYDVSIIFAKALQTAGFTTQIVRTGSTAIAWLRTEVPDLVVLDLALPEVSGKEVLGFIREDERLENTKVIVATAFAKLAGPVEERADWILMKPVRYPHLVDLARQLRGQKRGENLLVAEPPENGQSPD